MSDNRIEQTTSAHSPTGEPLINPRAVPAITALTSIGLIAEDLANNPEPWGIKRVAGLVVKLLPLLLGAMSPGWRRKG